MAKKKKPDDEDELLSEEAEVVEEVVEVDADASVEVEVEPDADASVEVSPDDLEPAGHKEGLHTADESGLESIEIADEDLAAVTADVDEDAVVAEPEEAGPEVVAEPPRAAVAMLNYVLIALNLIAVGAFAYFLLEDIQKRQEFSYAVFRNELAMVGLPTEDEEANPNMARGTLPPIRISSEYIKKVFGERPEAKNSPDPFDPVDEQIAPRIPPSMLTREILKEHFDKHFVDTGAEPIRTVEDEVKRIAKALPEEIKKAAEESAAIASKGGDINLRKGLDKLLLPLSMDTVQAEKLDKRIKSAQGKDLEALYIDAAERRMAFDFLLPIEIFRPGDPKVAIIEKFGDLEALPLDKVRDRVAERVLASIAPQFDPKVHLGDGWEGKERDSVEKRLAAAFTLLSLSYVKRPDGTPLYPNLSDRLPLVFGQYDFTVAASAFPRRVQLMQDRMLTLLRENRDGFEVLDKDGTTVRRSWGFPDKYTRDLDEIRDTQQNIAKATLRLADLEKDKTRYEQLLDERTKQRADILARISKARVKTDEENKELRLLQNELFEFQRQLAESDRALQLIGEKIQNASRKGGR